MDNEVKNITEGLIKYLGIRGQLDLLPAILQELETKTLQLAPENVALVTTAHKLGAMERKLIKNRLQSLFGRKLRLQVQVDPQVIGGIIIRVADKIIDLTINKDLDELAERLRD